MEQKGRTRSELRRPERLAASSYLLSQIALNFVPQHRFAVPAGTRRCLRRVLCRALLIASASSASFGAR
jgi:hypothetical protein